MQLIVGLGNPGTEYRNNRHNIGFMAIDAIAARHGFSPFKAKFSGLIADGTIDGNRVLLLKPQTFMNKSGDCVSKAANFYKIDTSDIIVIYDELDLAPGKVRVKTGGGTGGHNGLRSISPAIGENYKRVRLGIGHPGHKELVTRHVLGDFAKADADWLEPLLNEIGREAGLLVTGDDAGFMNKLALALQQSAPPPKSASKPTPKGQSHIRQARTNKSATPVPETGPMAAMLKKLFDKK
jgi:PTH1 family peptidyl-tRNA hydrolase